IRSTDSVGLTVYSEVVDALTKGHCIVERSELQSREFRQFLVDKFGVQGLTMPSPLAVGRGMEAFAAPEKLVDGRLHRFRDALNRALRERLLSEGTNRDQRRRIDKNFPTLLRQMPADQLPDVDQ